MSAYFDAIQQGDLDALRSRLAEQPDLARAQDASGATAVQVAAYHHQDEALALLLATRTAHDRPLDLFEAAAVGDTDRVRALVDDRPALLATRSGDGFPALGLAAFFGHLDTVRLLLELGADPALAAANAMRVTPLHSALAHRNQETVRATATLLLDAGAPVNARQAGGWTPLHQAAAAGNDALVDQLLSRGADPAEESDNGTSVVDMARERGHEALADRLAEST